MSSVIRPILFGIFLITFSATFAQTPSKKYVRKEAYSEHMAMVTGRNGKIGFVDELDSLIIPCVYQEAWDFVNGLAKVKQKNLYGFINIRNEQVIPIKYGTCYDDFADGIAVLELDTKWGAIDSKNNEVISFAWDYLSTDFNPSGLSRIQLKGKEGWINLKNQIVVPPQYNKVLVPVGDMCIVVLNERQGFYNIKMHQEIAAPKYFHVDVFCNGFAKYIPNAGYYCGYLNASGKEIGANDYFEVNCFANGRGLVKRGLKYGFVDETGQEVIPTKYEAATAFNSDGTASVKLDGEWTKIDLQGNRVK